MPASIDKEVEKKAFRAGYECISISLLDIPKSRKRYERYKFSVNYVIRDVYIFLKKFDENIFDEYSSKCDMENNYVGSELSPKDLDNAVTKVFEGYPEIVHAYFLSKICHFFLFGMHLNLRSSTSIITSSFDHLLSLHNSYDCWPYPLELRESLYSIYECIATNIWPPNTTIRHLYVCLADIYKITKEDLLETVGSGISAMDQYYQYLFPKEYKNILDIDGRYLNSIVFDDPFAFYTYLKTTNPKILHEYAEKNNDNINFQRIEEIEQEYQNLFNLEKIKYVNLANSSVTSEETNYVKLKISPLFERDMIFKKGFLEAHEDNFGQQLYNPRFSSEQSYSNLNLLSQARNWFGKLIKPKSD